jgi:hypothetical protein
MEKKHSQPKTQEFQVHPWKILVRTWKRLAAPLQPRATAARSPIFGQHVPPHRLPIQHSFSKLSRKFQKGPIEKRRPVRSHR